MTPQADTHRCKFYSPLCNRERPCGASRIESSINLRSTERKVGDNETGVHVLFKDLWNQDVGSRSYKSDKSSFREIFYLKDEQTNHLSANPRHARLWVFLPKSPCFEASKASLVSVLRLLPLRRRRTSAELRGLDKFDEHMQCRLYFLQHRLYRSPANRRRIVPELSGTSAGR